MSRPAIGTTVELVKDSHFLSDYHNARAGSLGIITANSSLNPDDNGVLVDWGDGKPVRCDLSEIKTSTRIKKDDQMSKTFKDVRESLDNVLAIGFDVNGLSLRTVTDSQNVGVVLTSSDAPAVCLAILEAAGVEACHRDYESYDDGSPAHLQAVMYFLKQYSEAQAERAVAEADRVALEAEALKLLNELRGVDGAIPFYDWTQVSEVGKKRWLAVARAARELNKETGQ